MVELLHTLDSINAVDEGLHVRVALLFAFSKKKHDLRNRFSLPEPQLSFVRNFFVIAFIHFIIFLHRLIFAEIHFRPVLTAKKVLTKVVNL